MSVYFLHEETGRYLTSIHKGVPGEEVTLSVGHPLTGGEFTTYRLGPVIGVSRYGENCFDLDEAEIAMDGQWYPIARLRAIRAARPYPGFVLDGRRYRVGAFGDYRLERANAPYCELEAA